MSRPSAAAVLLVAAFGLGACTHDDRSRSAARSSTSTTTAPSTTTIPAAPPSTTAAPAFAITSGDWDQVAYPLDCGRTLQGKVGTAVSQVTYADPAPDLHLAVVMVACQAGAGTPPRTIYIFDRATSSTAAHLLQTLSSDGLHQVTGALTVAGSTITTTGATYSANAPRCCPDGTFKATWTWSGTMYRHTS